MYPSTFYEKKAKFCNAIKISFRVLKQLMFAQVLSQEHHF